jgi:hypothetical protein
MSRKKPIDPFARKMIFGSFVYGGVMLVMFAVLTVVYLHTRPRCSDRVMAESASPDKQWIATIMERRCGEDTPFFVHVNLRPAAKDLHYGFFSGVAGEGEIFLAEQDVASAGLTFQWTAPNRLSIQCPRCNASLERKREDRWGSVVINYQIPPH